MKTRQGFVSNSSSTSFVLAIPLGYELTDEDFEFALGEGMAKEYGWDEYDGDTPESVQRGFQKITGPSRFLWNQDDGFMPIEVLAKQKGWVIGTLQGGPDDGQMINVVGEDTIDNLRGIIGVPNEEETRACEQ